MADIYFKCGCGKNLAIDESGAGRIVNCPDCGNRFTIPAAAIEWNCPQCAAGMQASGAMRGAWVQCLACKSEVKVPDFERPAAMPREQTPEEPQAENLAARLNRFFKKCPQCHGRIPVHTRQCPHCAHAFSKPAPRSAVAGALCALIMAGILLGLWRAGIWPFTPRPASPPAPSAPAPAAAPRPASNAVASAPAPAAVQTTPTEEVSNATNPPPAVPESTNAVNPEAWLVRVELARQLLAARMDRDYPWCSTGRFVSLRQLDGLMVYGTNAGATSVGVTLIAAGKPALIAFGNLDAYDRLKVDAEFRATWIDAQALALSRRVLEEEGLKLSGFSSNAMAAADLAISLGDPQAQYRLGQQSYKQQDYAHALLYLLAAAQNHAAAQYALGMMCYQGVGVGADKKAGLTWLALAAAQGHAKAEQFIQQHKLSAETRQKLLQQAKASREGETQEQAQALKTYRRRSQAPAPGSLKEPNP